MKYENANGNGPKLLDVEQAAKMTGTSDSLLATLKAAYGWNQRTRLQKENFIRLRDEWLAGPAKKGK